MILLSLIGMMGDTCLFRIRFCQLNFHTYFGDDIDINQMLLKISTFLGSIVHANEGNYFSRAGYNGTVPNDSLMFCSCATSVDILKSLSVLY